MDGLPTKKRDFGINKRDASRKLSGLRLHNAAWFTATNARGRDAVRYANN